MPQSGNFSRDQSISTDNSKLVHQQILAQQPDLDQAPSSDVDSATPPPPQKSKISIYPPELIYPKSRYFGYIPPLPTSKEYQACAALLQEFKNENSVRSPSTQEDFVEFELTDFSIYMPDTPLYGHELRALQDLASKASHSCLLFDGILSVGNLRHYVQGVPFKICSIGNYGEEVDDVDGAIWLQSDLNARANIYYRLRRPNPEYSRFHLGFLWLSSLAKHFVDYSLASQKQKKKVSIRNFRTEFAQWCRKVHAESSKFQSWYLEYGRDDFRQAVSANINFLFKESIGVTEKLRSLDIWKEVMEKSSIKQHPIVENMTIVTPYVYDCFSHLRFGHLLKPLIPTVFSKNTQGSEVHSPLSLSPRRSRITCDTDSSMKYQSTSFSGAKDSLGVEINKWEAAKRQKMLDAIKVGDVLSVTKDGSDSVWKDETSRWKVEDHCWYLYVQTKHTSPRGKYSFGGIWLYKPSDTSCAKMKYPYSKELFFSDNCTCGSAHSRIPQEEVIGTVFVVWHGLPSETDIFIRQTYLNNENFVTLTDSHKICKHLRMSEDDSSLSSMIIGRFPIGQTILALPPRRRSENGLEPYEVVKYDEESSKLYVTLRRLVRRSEFEKAVSCRPNELIYTDITDKMSAAKLEKTCLVRFYTEEQVLAGDIPAPYCRNGGSNAFIITKRLREDDQKLIPIENDTPQCLIQGFDPEAPLERRVLNGLDLFCGGGNFGRGLEEGGAVHNKWAVDLFSAAVQTYSTNLKEPDGTDMFFGSVNDLLVQAFEGNPRKFKIPSPGDVDVILAGSPCQGFSRMNMNKGNDQSLRNQSLIASVAAYIDFYRPKYGLLENVLTMAQKGLGREEDILSQLICTIVGLGYQVQLFLLDSWSFGSSQARSRIFVSFTAPGFVPLKHPELSHSHPPHVGERGLGKLANGQSFGTRIHCPTPFNYLTAEDSVADLPYIGDGATSQCTKYPDHVPPQTLSKMYKFQVSCIPTHPRGMNFSKTWNDGNGIMTKEERNIFPYLTKSGKVRESVRPGSRAWGRIDPRKLFPTILVTMNLEDSRMGMSLHWDQHRRLTIMEVRRAQSFPDDEVLIGTRGEQMKIIGNSVDRSVSMALGISLRNAWLECAPEDDSQRTLVKTQSSVTVMEPLHEIPNSSTSVAIEVVLSQRSKAMPHIVGTLSSVSDGIVTSTPTSSDSISSNLSGFDESSSSESIKNLRDALSRIQKRRRLVHSDDESSRKSPRLSPEINLPSKAIKPFARSIRNSSQASGLHSTRRPAPRSNFTQKVVRVRPEQASPDQGKPFITNDSETESENTIWVESGPRTSNLLYRTSHFHKSTPKTGNLKSPSTRSSHHKKFPHVIDLTESDSEGYVSNISSTLPQSSFKVMIPMPSFSTKLEEENNTISSSFPSRDQKVEGNRHRSASKGKYVPVDNSQFNAYAQTNRMMRNMGR
ncbi:c24bbdf2-bc2a-4a85-a645-34d668a75486 [Sclerotinia trifoliorum]|uniref:Cytosine-specific methyltransferase n=1 Tax=Sclerotinia trifoliorum TaxID=28548 RepID=A0A8H2W509_9HELO|nr:c24bbdf2-bc2a-4a85-a645-34d668a75486 [Sclerotinia trifoliorum]